MANKRDAKLHEGHRGRLRGKVLTGGIKSISKHEQVELFLTYVQARKDVNEEAHMLVNNLDNFYNIVNADLSDIKSIKGLSDKIYQHFRIFKEFFELYEECRDIGSAKLETTARCVNYFRKHVDFTNTEQAYLVMLNDNMELIKLTPISKSNKISEVEIDNVKIIKEIELKSPKYIVIFHTHPYGVVPSVADLMATTRILISCKGYNLTVADHIILNKKEHFSFKESGVMTELINLSKDKYAILWVDDESRYQPILDKINKGSV